MKKYLVENRYSYYDYGIKEWEEFCLANSVPKFRAKQICENLYHGRNNPQKFNNIPKEIRQIILDKVDLHSIAVEKVLRSEIDGTVKYLFRLFDGAFVEAVLMFYKYGASICISTQVGCSMGCKFCASAKLGLERNLSAGEMLEQIFLISSLENIKVHNVVLMGIGEPMDNLANVLRFVNMASSPDILNIGKRRITISTCGMVEQINYLAKLKPQFTLSISIHAASQAKRSKIMPIANKYSLDELIRACRNYLQSGGKRITFEYIMLRDFNDSIKDAETLAKLLKGMLAHVNLIPTNEIEGAPFHASSLESINNFKSVLDKSKISCTIRRSLGQDILAACGQLRKSHTKNSTDLD